jgi:hypothetical protein
VFIESRYHGTQHKTEAAAILTGFGHSPGDIDLVVHMNETSALKAEAHTG